MTPAPYPDPSTLAPRRTHLWLLCLPFVWQLAMASFINDVTYTPFGIPFAMAWQMMGVVLASVVFALVFALDRRAGVEAEEDAFIAAIEAEEAALGLQPRQAGH
jgi:ABC-type molybdate transport system permease subunit